MSTIHVVYGCKQYSDAAIIVAAFDTAEAANDFRLLVDALEPRYTLKVQECELRSSRPDGSIARISVPTKQPRPIDLPVGQPTATWAGSPRSGAPRMAPPPPNSMRCSDGRTNRKRPATTSAGRTGSAWGGRDLQRCSPHPTKVWGILPLSL